MSESDEQGNDKLPALETIVGEYYSKAQLDANGLTLMRFQSRFSFFYKDAQVYFFTHDGEREDGRFFYLKQILERPLNHD